MKLFDSLKKLRREKGLSVKQLAVLVKKSPSTVYCWESDVFQPGFDTICLLADLYGCSADYLLGRENDAGIIEIHKELGDKEKYLLTQYNSVGDEKKLLIRTLIKVMGEK